MNKITVYGAAALALTSVASRAQAGHRSHSSSTSTNEGRNVRTCGDLGVQFGDRDALTGRSEITIPRSELSTLEISPSRNGGVWVEGSGGSDFQVTLCKAVPEGDGAKAELDAIAFSRRGDHLGVQGPSGDEWVAHMIVRAPRDSSISLDSENGPVALLDFAGSAKIKSQNGPVSIRGCRGEILVDSQNGPIQVSQSSGNVTLEARNGPLSVHLPEGGWSGGQLAGRTQNGPLNLQLTGETGSGVRVETAGRSPFLCHGDACRSARRDWDDDHKRIEFGSAEPLVRLSTVNGPVSIDSGN